MAPPSFKDIGKKSSGLVNDDYKYEGKAELKSAVNGVVGRPPNENGPPTVATHGQRVGRNHARTHARTLARTLARIEASHWHHTGQDLAAPLPSLPLRVWRMALPSSSRSSSRGALLGGMALCAVGEGGKGDEKGDLRGWRHVVGGDGDGAGFVSIFVTAWLLERRDLSRVVLCVVCCGVVWCGVRCGAVCGSE